jgi:hypothetical protein
LGDDRHGDIAPWLQRRRRFNPGDLLQELTRTPEASGKAIRMLLLEGRSKVIPVMVILLNRSAMILQDVDGILAVGARNFEDATLGKAARSQHIGNMDSVHPV